VIDDHAVTMGRLCRGLCSKSWNKQWNRTTDSSEVTSAIPNQKTRESSSTTQAPQEPTSSSSTQPLARKFNPQRVRSQPQSFPGHNCLHAISLTSIVWSNLVFVTLLLCEIFSSFSPLRGQKCGIFDYLVTIVLNILYDIITMWFFLVAYNHLSCHFFIEFVLRVIFFLKCLV